MKFQNGRLSAFTKENTHFTRLRNKEEPNKFGALLAANGSLYHGHINNTEASELTDTYICVRNKKTNQVITQFVSSLLPLLEENQGWKDQRNSSMKQPSFETILFRHSSMWTANSTTFMTKNKNI